MNISELIKQLEEVKKEHGEVDVYLSGEDDGDLQNLSYVEVFKNKEKYVELF